jgi:hypothetical protein
MTKEELMAKYAALPDAEKPNAANLLKRIAALLEQYPDGIDLDGGSDD